MQNAEANEGANEDSPLLSNPSEGEVLPVAKKFKFYLDPGVFLLFFGWNLSSTVLANEILIQTCYVTFNFSYDDCILLGRRNESAEVKVRSILSTTNTWLANQIVFSTSTMPFSLTWQKCSW